MNGFLQVIPGKGVRKGQSGAVMGLDWGVGDTLPEMPEKRAFWGMHRHQQVPEGTPGTTPVARVRGYISEIFIRGYINYPLVAVQRH